MKLLPKKIILEIKPYIPGKPIDEVKRELGLKEVIKLASNENPYGPSPKAIKAIADAARDVNRYPDGDCFYLREALAKRLKIDQRQLIFGNGSDELIVMAVRSFVYPGDEVIIAKPSFLIYDIASRAEGAVVREVPLKDFRYDLPAMLKEITSKTKIIFLGNPDNPSGSYFTQKQMEGFLKNVREDILVFMDEAYHEYVDQKDYVDSVHLLKKHDNVIVTRTFSKMYGLAGLRLGYGIAATELVDVLNRVREPFNVNSLAQAGAIAVLKDKTYYAGLAKKVAQQRKFLCESFKELKLSYVESFTNFILIHISQDSTQLCQKLMRKGVIIRDMSHWGLKGFIRVTIGTESENRKLIKALKEAL
jgi:histidinol-phosphate aminotransferase